jgi:hypothetical protein
MIKKIDVDEFLVEMGGYDLDEQLSIWLDEMEWSEQRITVSLTPDPDIATVALEVSFYDNFTGKTLAYAMRCGLSEDFELVSREPLAGTDGRTDYIVFTVKSL